MAPRKSRLGALSPSYLIRRRAVAKGVFGGDRSWQVIAGIIYGAKFLRKNLGKQPQTLISETLKPGEVMTIRTEKPTKAARKRRS